MKPICDFCSGPNVMHYYQVDTFMLAKGAPHVADLKSLEGWMACEECGALIAHDRWDDLIERAMLMFERKYGPWPSKRGRDYARSEIARGFELFRQHRKQDS